MAGADVRRVAVSLAEEFARLARARAVAFNDYEGAREFERQARFSVFRDARDEFFGFCANNAAEIEAALRLRAAVCEPSAAAIEAFGLRLDYVAVGRERFVTYNSIRAALRAVADSAEREGGQQ